MSKFIKIFILGLILLVGIGIFANPVKASDDFSLELMSPSWDIIYGGETKTADLKITNNTGYSLDGEATFSAWYEGEPFQGTLIAINPSFGLSNNRSEWINGNVIFSDFEISEGETLTALEIKTHPALMPGQYSFTLKLEGIPVETGEPGEPYVAGVIIGDGGGGGGGYTLPTTPNTNTGKVVATPGEGGITTFTNSDGSKIKLTIPAGAVSGNTVFTIEKVDIDLINQPSPGSGLFLINGSVYEIKARDGTKSIITFDKSLILTFTYTDEQIKGLDEDSLKVYYWNGEEWIAIENSEVNKDDNIITASIDHLTLFALMGSKIKLIEEEIKEEEIIEETGISEILKETPEKIKEGIKKIVEAITSLAPSGEAKKPSASEEEITLPGETASPVTGTPQRGLASMVAAVGMTWEEISKSAFLTIVVILCLIALVFIGFKEWRLYKKKRRNSK